MHFCDHILPAEEELRAWAAAEQAEWPSPAWDYELTTFAFERGRFATFVQLAGDPSLPQRRFFLYLLYYWLWRLTREPSFDSRRVIFDGWIDDVQVPHDRALRQWRHSAKRILQGLD